MLHVASISDAEILPEISDKDEKHEKENMIIEQSDKSSKLKEYSNSNLMNSESINLIEPNNINNNNNIQFNNNNNYLNDFFQPGVISEIEGGDKSFTNLFSRISSKSFLDDSEMGSISNILELKDKKEIYEFVKDKMNKGLTPFFIKFEQYAPLPIFAPKNIRFIDIIYIIQEEIQFDVNSVVFILKGKPIEISSYYNKFIEDFKIEPLETIQAKEKK